MNRCKHGIIADLCVRCELHGKAVDSIKQQPFFKTKRERWGIGARTTAWAAREMLNHVKTMPSMFIWNGPLQRIRRQPFFGVDSSLPTTIKIRRPVPFKVRTESLEQPSYMDEVIEIGAISDRTAKHTPPFSVSGHAAYAMDEMINDAVNGGVGFARINPVDVWKVEPPIYTLRDICWKSYA